MIMYGIAVGYSRALGVWSGVLAAAFGAWLVVLYFAGQRGPRGAVPRRASARRKRTDPPDPRRSREGSLVRYRPVT
jgi:hypothetical protein